MILSKLLSTATVLVALASAAPDFYPPKPLIDKREANAEATPPEFYGTPGRRLNKREAEAQRDMYGRPGALLNKRDAEAEAAPDYYPPHPRLDKREANPDPKAEAEAQRDMYGRPGALLNKRDPEPEAKPEAQIYGPYGVYEDVKRRS